MFFLFLLTRFKLKVRRRKNILARERLKSKEAKQLQILFFMIPPSPCVRLVHILRLFPAMERADLRIMKTNNPIRSLFGSAARRLARFKGMMKEALLGDL
jgi:hypothetical protein